MFVSLECTWCPAVLLYFISYKIYIRLHKKLTLIKFFANNFILEGMSFEQKIKHNMRTLLLLQNFSQWCAGLIIKMPEKPNHNRVGYYLVTPHLSRVSVGLCHVLIKRPTAASMCCIICSGGTTLNRFVRGSFHNQFKKKKIKIHPFCIFGLSTSNLAILLLKRGVVIIVLLSVAVFCG